MFPKIGLYIVLLAVEIFLGIYSLIISESLLIKFVFFLATAVIVAYCIAKFTTKALPSEEIFEGQENVKSKNHDSKEDE